VEDWNWETIGLFCGHYRSITTVTYLASEAIAFGEKKQNNGYYAVQSLSRSSRTLSIESPYAVSYSD